MTEVWITLGSTVLVLTSEQFYEALERGFCCQQRATRHQDEEPLLTAEQIEQQTGVPATWYAEAARRGDIPHYRIGKYPRFRLSEIATATRKQGSALQPGVEQV
jgi:hypothetical protein